MHRDEETDDTYELGPNAQRDVARGKLCPECWSTDTESNGSTEYRCRQCDHRWGRDNGERYGY